LGGATNLDIGSLDTFLEALEKRHEYFHAQGCRLSDHGLNHCFADFGPKAKAAAVYQGMTPLSAEDIAEQIHWVASLPAHVNINRLEIMPVAQSWAGFAVHRESK
jgi:glucuronate isomerase